MRKVARGAVDESYGIEVAKLAGLNHEIIDIAKNVLVNLEKQIECKDIIQHKYNSINFVEEKTIDDSDELQKIFEVIASIDIMNLTPVVALGKLNEIVEDCKRLVKNK